MLYIGEKLGKGGDAVDIAVDPIEGTRMVAMGQANALATIAVAEKDGFLKAPDMYMEKLIVGPKARGVIDLNLPIEQNILAVAEALGKDVSDITVITLSKPRHDMMIKSVQDMGAKVFAIPDGDVAASILTCMPLSDVDMLYGIGGAPEGVVSAAVVRALGGDMNGRLLIRTDVKGDTSENQILAKMEMKRCKQMEVEINRVYKLDELAKTDNVIFSATGITKGDLLEGVRKEGVFAETETLLIRGKSRTVRKIHSTHYLERKDQVIKELVL
jgi:fructose-1,6-bisphosphatase II